MLLQVCDWKGFFMLQIWRKAGKQVDTTDGPPDQATSVQGLQ